MFGPDITMSHYDMVSYHSTLGIIGYTPKELHQWATNTFQIPPDEGLRDFVQQAQDSLVEYCRSHQKVNQPKYRLQSRYDLTFRKMTSYSWNSVKKKKYWGLLCSSCFVQWCPRRVKTLGVNFEIESWRILLMTAWLLLQSFMSWWSRDGRR